LLEFFLAKSFRSQMISSFNPNLKFADQHSTIVDLLRYRADHQPNEVAFSFLLDGEREIDSLTYQALDLRSRAIAGSVLQLVAPGDRAILLYPPGLDYLTAFLGCLYAGVIAVPAYPPRSTRNTPRVLAVIADAQAAIALTTTSVFAQVQAQ
jgi:acyl-CoA synthetase (AMP-forming)/AMP-acid ligase II